jgi:TRAP-type transport system periplasmic protein
MRPSLAASTWLVLLALAGLASCARAPAPGPSTATGEAPTVLVYATPYSPNHPFSRADRRWMDFVEQRSGGSLKIKPSWSGALLSSEHSMVELRHGVVDIGLITPIYVKGGAHLIRIQSGFYMGTDTIEEQVALYRCLSEGNAQFARELEGLVVLAVQGGSLPGIVTRDRPVTSLADLNGMRIRAPTELLPVLRDLGVDPVNMPMGEVYSALAKGVIDGVIAPEDTFKSLHLAEVAKHFAVLKIPRGAYPARAMGEARWQQLTEAQREVLREGVAVWEKESPWRRSPGFSSRISPPGTRRTSMRCTCARRSATRSRWTGTDSTAGSCSSGPGQASVPMAISTAWRRTECLRYSKAFASRISAM